MRLTSHIYSRIEFILPIALLFVGCRRAEPPQFSPSAALQSRVNDAETDEDRKLWQNLQKQIEAELAKRFGTPLAPIVFGDPEADRSTLQLGAQVYTFRCQSCHGIDGNGLGRVAGYLNPKPRDYTDATWQASVTDDEIRKTILLGGQAVGKSATMPGQPQLKQQPEVLDGLVKIIRGFAR